jgi:hypothetical protein
VVRLGRLLVCILVTYPAAGANMDSTHEAEFMPPPANMRSRLGDKLSNGHLFSVPWS